MRSVGQWRGCDAARSVSVTTDGTGNAAIPFVAVPLFQFITATATNASTNNTSEFSACVQATPGAARTWITDAGGNWEDPANWSGGVAPQNGDNVVIDRPGATPLIGVQTAVVTLASFRSEEPILMSGGALTFDGLAQFNGGLLMSAGNLTGAGECCWEAPRLHRREHQRLGRDHGSSRVHADGQQPRSRRRARAPHHESRHPHLGSASLQLTNGATIINETDGFFGIRAICP